MRRVDAALQEPCTAPVDEISTAGGSGLAAPRIDEAGRVFAMDAGWTETGQRSPRRFVNPGVIDVSEASAVRREASLPLPGRARTISRPADVRVAWQDRAGAPHEACVSGVEATLVQHEIDHLDGLLILDHPDPTA